MTQGEQVRFQLQRVKYMPKEFESGVLYVSEEFNIAIHLCACGCGSKVRTPLSPIDWSVKETPHGPTLFPSVGNWQLPCQSHYWIRRGEVKWARKWTLEQIEAGRRYEEERRRNYFDSADHERKGFIKQFRRWLKGR